MPGKVARMNVADIRAAVRVLSELGTKPDRAGFYYVRPHRKNRRLVLALARGGMIDLVPWRPEMAKHTIG